MANIKAICVYCGSSPGEKPIYVEAATRLGKAFADRNIRLVYGGGSVGLMGTVARGVLENQGQVTGIIPRFLANKEIMLKEAHELIVTEDMHERKKLMFEHADAFVALPGGIGTLEELIEMLTWAQLGRHNKPVVLANVDGFWNPLLSLLNHMAEQKFVAREFVDRILTVDDPADIVDALIKAADAIDPEAWDHSSSADALSNL